MGDRQGLGSGRTPGSAKTSHALLLERPIRAARFRGLQNAASAGVAVAVQPGNPFMETPANTSSRIEWLAPAVVSLVCVSPFLVFWNRFETFYWIHDDWDMISELQSLGLVRWMQQPFGENFVPLFKAFWAGAIPLLDGSYFGMLCLLWITHVAILLLFAVLLRRFGLSWPAQSLAVLTLGMPWSNIEALVWATQWSSLLATFFLLLAWLLLLAAESGKHSTWLSVLAALSALASASCFPRGVLTGALLGLFLLQAFSEDRTTRRWRLWMAVVLICITCIAVLPYRWMIHDYHNFQEFNAAKLQGMASYAAHYWLLNPLYHLLPIPKKAVNAEALFIAGACKALVLGAGLYVSTARQRRLLETLLLLDAGTAVLLSMGRFDLGVASSVVSRYQYASLLCFAPFFAIAVTKGLGLLRPMASRAALAVLLVGWGLLLGYPWARHSARWAQWRGQNVKDAVVATPADQRFGNAWTTAGRARELIQIYHLH